LNRLKKNKFRNTEWLSVDGNEFLLVNDPHALIKAAGYLKYVHGGEDSEGVYFRGQGKIYGSLSPALYRNITTQKARDKREYELKQVLAEVRKSAGIFSTFGDYAHEALIQHYGISTTWIDLVDNVWVALWFACNHAIVSGKYKEHLHFEERIAAGSDRYAFILFVAADIEQRNRKMPGYYFGPKTELVDLRVAAPSIFLRPHAQHGLLFRQKASATTGRPKDYRNQIRGVIGVELARAIEWLGAGRMVAVHSLFPPPLYDEGYDILLNLDLGSHSIGSIVHIGA
jgi:hypothetical protein